MIAIHFVCQYSEKSRFFVFFVVPAVYCMRAIEVIIFVVSSFSSFAAACSKRE